MNGLACTRPTETNDWPQPGTLHILLEPAEDKKSTDLKLIERRIKPRLHQSRRMRTNVRIRKNLKMLSDIHNEYLTNILRMNNKLYNKCRRISSSKSLTQSFRRYKWTSSSSLRKLSADQMTKFWEIVNQWYSSGNKTMLLTLQLPIA